MDERIDRITNVLDRYNLLTPYIMLTSIYPFFVWNIVRGSWPSETDWLWIIGSGLAIYFVAGWSSRKRYQHLLHLPRAAIGLVVGAFFAPIVNMTLTMDGKWTLFITGGMSLGLLVVSVYALSFTWMGMDETELVERGWLLAEEAEELQSAMSDEDKRLP